MYKLSIWVLQNIETNRSTNRNHTPVQGHKRGVALDGTLKHVSIVGIQSVGTRQTQSGANIDFTQGRLEFHCRDPGLLHAVG